MTVRQLLARLVDFDPNLPVAIENDGFPTDIEAVLPGHAYVNDEGEVETGRLPLGPGSIAVVVIRSTVGPFDYEEAFDRSRP